MSVTLVTRWQCDDARAIIAAARKAAPLVTEAGALSMRLEQVFDGAHTGHWLTLIEYEDWAAYARVSYGLGTNAVYRDVIAELSQAGRLVERHFLTGIRLGKA